MIGDMLRNFSMRLQVWILINRTQRTSSNLCTNGRATTIVDRDKAVQKIHPPESPVQTARTHKLIIFIKCVVG